MRRGMRVEDMRHPCGTIRVPMQFHPRTRPGIGQIAVDAGHMLRRQRKAARGAHSTWLRSKRFLVTRDTRLWHPLGPTRVNFIFYIVEFMRTTNRMNGWLGREDSKPEAGLVPECCGVVGERGNGWGGGTPKPKSRAVPFTIGNC